MGNPRTEVVVNIDLPDGITPEELYERVKQEMFKRTSQYPERICEATDYGTIRFYRHMHSDDIVAVNAVVSRWRRIGFRQGMVAGMVIGGVAMALIIMVFR